MFQPNATLLVFVVMFLLFMVALNAMVLKPIGMVLDKRREKIKSDIETGATARAKAAAIVGDYQKTVHDARMQGQTLIGDAETSAQKARQAELKRVLDAGQVKLQEAKQGIAAERTALIGHLVEEEKTLVAMIVKKLLGDSSSVVVDTDKARQVLVEEAS